MFARAGLRTRIVTGVVLVGGAIVLGLAYGSRSEASAGTAAGISAGLDHTCALLSNGTVRCWGDNSFGELGDGATNSSSTPVAVKDIGSAIELSAGFDHHTCALLADHRIACWGENRLGQLGNGATVNSPTPVRVKGITTAAQVSAGYKQTCAVLSDHGVECWGLNQYGNLGDGTTANSPTPVRVKGIANAIQVSVGAGFACALLSDHTVKCWGESFEGQLGGDYTTTNHHPSPTPVRGIMSAVRLSVGTTHACVLLANRKIDCWGDEALGELGNGVHGFDKIGNDLFSSGPVPVTGITNAAQVSAGAMQTCAVLSNQRVKCWGDNRNGQLGIGSTGWFKATPVPTRGVSNAVAVSVDRGHVCAVLSGRRFACWGGNSSGQLGNGKTTDSSTPVSVVGLH